MSALPAGFVTHALDGGHVFHEGRLPESLATRAGADGDGCYFYGALFAELLRVLSGFEGAMLHDRCRAKGDNTCYWRAAAVEGYD